MGGSSYRVFELPGVDCNCIRRRFLIIQFLAIKLWVRIPLQTGDSPSAHLLSFCVNFHKCVSVAFYGEIRPALCAASCVVMIDFELADRKTREL